MARKPIRATAFRWARRGLLNTVPSDMYRGSCSFWPVARDKIADPVGARFGGGRIAVGPAAPTGEGDTEGEVGGARGAGGRIAYSAVGGAAG